MLCQFRGLFTIESPIDGADIPMMPMNTCFGAIFVNNSPVYVINCIRNRERDVQKISKTFKNRVDVDCKNKPSESQCRSGAVYRLLVGHCALSFERCILPLTPS